MFQVLGRVEVGVGEELLQALHLQEGAVEAEPVPEGMTRLPSGKIMTYRRSSVS